MKYEEYLVCAEKHLKGCVSLLSSYKSDSENEKHVWLELYYLSGYILEGITVYSAYKLNGWDPSEDIAKRYNLEFTKRTNLDFYQNRKSTKYIIPSYYQERPEGAMCVERHRFQDIVKNLLNINPAVDKVPYFGIGVAIEEDIKDLIDRWRPNVRYYYHSYPKCSLPELNRDVISRLLETCKIIYSKHI